MRVTIKKRVSASRSYGRGMDNYRSPGKYDINYGGNTVGAILGTNARQYESSSWTVCLYDAKGNFRPVKEFFPGLVATTPFETAKKWARDNVAAHVTRINQEKEDAKMNKNQDDIDRLNEIKDQLKELVGEARDIISNYGAAQRQAEAYWISNVLTSLDSDNEWGHAGCMSTMQETIDEITADGLEHDAQIDVKVGQRVLLLDGSDNKGEVTGYASDGTILVEWDNGIESHHNPNNIEPVDSDDNERAE